MDETLNTFLNVGIFLLLSIGLVVLYRVATHYLNIFEKRVDAEIRPDQLFLVEQIASTLVGAAEQIFGIEGSNVQKKEYVLDLIVKQFPGLDKALLNSIIENAVLEYKKFREEILDETK